MFFPGALAAVILILFAALYYAYRMAFYYRDPHADPRDYPGDDQIEKLRNAIDQATASFLAVPYEAVTITSYDGLTLTGHYYHLADNAPLYILMHGYKGHAARDFCGTWKTARALGHNVLLADQRCHGSSGGHTITFGIREHRDCRSWAEYAARRFGPVPTVLMGVSMGAATVLMAAGKDLPPNVAGIVADCPYDTPANIIRKVLQVEMGLPVKLAYPLVRLGGMLYGGFDVESYSPLEALPQAAVPVLLIHGEADRFVPCEMSHALRAAAPDRIQLRTIPGSGHALNQLSDPGLYHSILESFLRRILPQEAPSL